VACDIAKNTYFEPEFNDLCGFTPQELRKIIEQIVHDCGYDRGKTREALEIIKTYYNGYVFSFSNQKPVYNPTLSGFIFILFRGINSSRRNLKPGSNSQGSQPGYSKPLCRTYSTYASA
jgi:hypothetical protein